MSNKKYLCIQRSEGGQCEPPSPSQMEEMFARFNAWKDKYKDNIVDMGGKLSPEGMVVSGDSVSDGPFAESKEIVGGFMIVQAESMAFATEVVQQSPGVGMPGSTVEIREITTP